MINHAIAKLSEGAGLGLSRLIAVVSELGLGSAAQADSLGSLVLPAWVGAALGFFLMSFWGLSSTAADRY